MDCVDITDKLLLADDEESGHDLELHDHVASCIRCAHLARGVERLDVVLRAAMIIAPPFDLQRQLAQLAYEATLPKPLPWWRQLFSQRPQLIAAQGLAAVMLALASWQIFGWVSAFQPVVGDVAYAVELVAASPAAVYLGGMQIDLQSLGLWSLVGIGGWLVSENGVIGRRLAASGLRLP